MKNKPRKRDHISRNISIQNWTQPNSVINILARILYIHATTNSNKCHIKKKNNNLTPQTHFQWNLIKCKKKVNEWTKNYENELYQQAKYTKKIMINQNWHQIRYIESIEWKRKMKRKKNE